MTLKIGLIGCSRVAQKNFIPTIQSSEFAEITSIGSRSPKKAKIWSKEINCKKFGNYDDVINSDVNCVYISLPDGLHEEWTLKAAQFGKHVLCEKSSTTSLKSAQKMVECCKDNNVRILECFSFRFHPQHKLVLDLITNNELGEIYNFTGKFGYSKPDKNNIRLQKNLGGGSLNDATCYPICASRIIFNSEPTGVMANFNYNSSEIDMGSSIFLTFDDKNAFVEGGFDRNFQSTYEIWGSQGFLKMKRAFAIPPNLGTNIQLVQNDVEKNFPIKPYNQTYNMLKTFYDEIKSNNKSFFNFEEDLLSQARVMEAARLSNKEKKYVLLDELR